MTRPLRLARPRNTAPAQIRPMLAGLTYGLAMLAAGWTLGPIRVLVVEPRLGPTLAVLVEAPILLVSAALVAGGLLKHGWVGPSALERLAFGVLGATVGLVGEFVTAAMVWGPSAGLGLMETTPGRIGLLLIAVTAVLPVFLSRTSGREMAAGLR